ncbi:hypothetical protein I656_02153 [Geobacillus sp. WSUCF1]|nr:hypothetical protein I656_02153 [Geobacillus sp. WSUCF1]
MHRKELEDWCTRRSLSRLIFHQNKRWSGFCGRLPEHRCL